MAFFRTINFSEPLPSIVGEGVILRAPQMTDYAEWAALREAEPRISHAVGADLAGRRSQPQRVPPPHPALCRGPAHRPAYAFLIFRRADGSAGRRADARQYPARRRAGRQPRLLDGAAYARSGYMTAAVRAVIPFAFGTLRLHRLEAACIPANAASIRLLEKTGFVREGYAREYLCINGIWQDHLLYGRLKDSKG